MFDHIGLTVANLETSVRFYQAALKALGQVLASRDETSAGLGPEGSPGLWLYTGKRAGSGTHVALTAPDRASVDRFYAAGIEHGGRNNGKPGVRVDYGPTYYAAFLFDPDGNNVEAVCLK